MTDAKEKTNDPPEQRHFLTDLQLAARWGISAKTLRNARVAGGHIPFVRFGRLVRYRVSDVVAWERENTYASTSGRGQRP